MIRHIVWWTLKPTAEGNTAEVNGQKIKELGESLAGKIPSLKSIEISLNIQASSTLPAHVVLHSTHDDMAGLKAYADHPEHQVLLHLVRATTDSRQALDYEF